MPKFVNEFFQMREATIESLAERKPKFGYDGFGEIAFYRTYSRETINGGQENWHDVVTRVINGCFSIRKDWYKKNFIHWDESYWQLRAARMAHSLFGFKWMPAGRGLWAMGTNHVYENGSMALNNCAATILGGNDRFANDIHWLMDCLMLGAGVGFEPLRTGLRVYKPVGSYLHYVGDSREGWIHSVKLMIQAYTTLGAKLPIFDYSRVRKKGEKIKGFGGLASGPEPLAQLHREIKGLFETDGIDEVRLKTDIANLVGVCVVSGNVRRSAELAKGNIHDSIFLELKNWEKYPEREDHGGMSNNTVGLLEDIDFEALGEVATRVIIRGEPGVANLRNFPYGRIGKFKDVNRPDEATLLNPCGEIPLVDKELCNVAETCPTLCETTEEWYDACEDATLYTSTVSLLPTHREETNRVVTRNRRIGVGIIDWTGWVKAHGMHRVIRYMRAGYKRVCKANQTLNAEAGVPEAIRKTTVKPGGTTPKLPGLTPGIGYPTFDFTLRRIRIASNSPVCPILDAANIPSEPEFFDPIGTRVFEYPTIQGPADPAEKVSLWQQAMNLITVQSEWADNAVSNTLYFRPKWKLTYSRATFNASTEDEKVNQVINFRYEIEQKLQHSIAIDHIPFIGNGSAVEEQSWKLTQKINKWGEVEVNLYEFDPSHEEDIIEPVLSSTVPHIKSLSLLPHSAKGAYRQMPEEGLTEDEYMSRLSDIGERDWSTFVGSDGIDERFCSGPSCEVIRK